MAAPWGPTGVEGAVVADMGELTAHGDVVLPAVFIAWLEWLCWRLVSQMPMFVVYSIASYRPQRRVCRCTHVRRMVWIYGVVCSDASHAVVI